MQFKLTPPPPSHGQYWLVTSQTRFTYLAHVKVLNFVRGGGGGFLVKAMFMTVYVRLAAVSKRGKVRIKVTWTKIFDFIFKYNEFGA